jgi:hypothetical protein
MLSSIFGMAVECLLHVIRLVPLQKGEQSRDDTDSSHDIVHVSCVDDDISPMIPGFWILEPTQLMHVDLFGRKPTGLCLEPHIE